jgi:hypothetical protein
MKELTSPPDAPMLIGGYVGYPEADDILRVDSQSFVLIPTRQYLAMRDVIERAENKVGRLMALEQFFKNEAGGQGNTWAREVMVGVKVLQFVLGKDSL